MSNGRKVNYKRRYQVTAVRGDYTLYILLRVIFCSTEYPLFIWIAERRDRCGLLDDKTAYALCSLRAFARRRDRHAALRTAHGRFNQLAHIRVIQSELQAGCAARIHMYSGGLKPPPLSPPFAPRQNNSRGFRRPSPAGVFAAVSITHGSNTRARCRSH